MKLVLAFVAVAFAAILLFNAASAVDCSPNPDHLEICDNKDNDCDGQVDENCKIIIWWHLAWDDPAYLQNVIDSGLVTHIMINNAHRKDVWPENQTIKVNILKAIEMIRKVGIKIIWSRDLWPYENQSGIELGDFFDSSYYIQEISFLKKEAAELGADFRSLDTEPYGTSPMKQYLKGDRTPLTPEQETELANAIQTAITAEGKVDFIYPAGSLDSSHPYNELAKLGNRKIAENTYYDEKINIPYSYEIFGAFVDYKPGDYSGHPLYTIQTIFNKSDGWINKNGLFLYSQGDNNTIEVSKQLLAYSKDFDKDGFAFDVDCNDSNNLIYPGATEVCDGTDNDCDGEIDEGNVCCGNNQCDAGETFETCPTDCKCGNGVCEAELGETIGSCPADCQECVDNEKLVGQYIPQWKRGEISMLTLMQKIRQRNAGTGCPTPA